MCFGQLPFFLCVPLSSWVTELRDMGKRWLRSCLAGWALWAQLENKENTRNREH